MKLAKIFSYLMDFLGLSKSIRVVNFPITDNCNSECVMCNIWKNNKENEISPEEIERIFADKKFSKVQHLGISGGEPSLRKDLVRCVAAIFNSLTQLKTLSITTHGYNTSRWAKFLPFISEYSKRSGVSFSLNISLDGYGKKHDEIRGINKAFAKSRETLLLAKQLGIVVQLQYTISKSNAYSMQIALEYALDQEVEIVYRLATDIERLYNKDRASVFIDQEEKSFVADFFRSKLLMKQTKSISRRLYYKRMADWLVNGGKRDMPCYFMERGILLSPLPAAYPCSVTKHAISENLRNSSYAISEQSLEMARQQTQQDYCNSCVHDQSGVWSPKSIILSKITNSLAVNNLFKLTRFISNILLSSLLLIRNLLSISFEKKPSKKENCLLVGAYGGEHVGDAAILGGVILRLKKEYGAKHVTILSFRPDRTKKWINSIKIEEISIDVLYFNKNNVRKNIGSHDLLVYAGGPIMDIPLNLSLYIYTVLFAKIRKVPFFIEGVGLGPYKRKISRFLAALLLRNADKIVLRSRANLEKLPLVNNIKIHDVKQDPAFDYINYCKEKINNTVLDSRDYYELKKLDRYISNRSKVLYVNLRPIWDAYILNQMEQCDNIRDSVADKISSFINNLAEEWAVVFCPFNPDTYGFSDFSSFYDVIKRINPKRDYYVIEYEPDVSFMMKLLTRCTKFLAMRFHACIFGVNMNCDVYGIDYQVGDSGKVAHLFDSLSNKNYSNVLDLNVSTMVAWANQING